MEEIDGPLHGQICITMPNMILMIHGTAVVPHHVPCYSICIVLASLCLETEDMCVCAYVCACTNTCMRICIFASALHILFYVVLK